MTDLKKAFEQHLKAQEKAQIEPAKKYKWTYNELKNLKEKQEFLLNGLIPLGELCLMIGTDGIGKSGLALQLGLEFGFGVDFCGIPWNKDLARNVLFVATEDGHIKFSDRLKDMTQHYEKNYEVKEPHFNFYDASEFDSLKEFEAALEKDFQEGDDYKLIIVDTAADIITSLAGQEINDFNGTNQALEPFKKIGRKYKCTFVFVHHVAKSKLYEKKKRDEFFVVKDDTFGSSRLTGKPRLLLALTNDPKSEEQNGDKWTNYLHVAKSNIKGTRKYQNNAFKLEFDGSHGVHIYKDMVNIKEFEEEYFNKEKSETPDFKFEMSSASIDVHCEMIDNVFMHKSILNYEEFLDGIINIYGIKKRNAQDSIAYLQKNDIIKENLGQFTKGSVFDDLDNKEDLPPF